MQAGFGRQIGCRRCDPLDTRLLIVGDYGYCIGWFCLRPGCGLLQQLHFAINAEHFGHLFRKLGVAALQVIPDFMRLHLLLVEDLAHSALRQMGETRVPLRRSMLASVTGQKPRCPQFVRIAQILRLPARQRYQPCLGFDGDRWLPTRARAIVQRDDRTFHRRPLDTSLHGLMMDSKRLAHREKRWLFPIAQQYPCPLHPTRRFRSRLRYRPQVLDVRISKRHFNRPPPRCHSFSSFVSRPPTADIGV